MKFMLLSILVLFLFSVPVAAAELTLKEAEEFLANVEQLYEPSNEGVTSSKGFYYPVVDICKLWQKAGIKPKPLRGQSNNFLFGYKLGTKEKCNLKYPVSKLYSKGDFKVLRIGSSSFAVTADYQFLFFKKEKDKWNYFDYTYALREKHGEPEITFLDTILFYINELAGSGTGTLGFEYTFYTISDDKVEDLLWCPDRGYLDGWGLMFNREYESKVDYSEGFLIINYTINVEANTYYYEPKEGERVRAFPLFTINRKVVFNWDEKTLSIDDEKSQFITIDDVKNIFRGADKEYYTMFQAEFDKLKNGNAEQKEWYELFMKELK